MILPRPAYATAFPDFVVVREHPKLIQYVDGLQRKNAEALSFYPRACFEREALKGRLFLGLLNNEPCGYIYVGAGKDGDMKCHQVCIQYDARRRLYGAALVAVLEDYALREKAARVVTLRCGFDLEANDFWQTMGYGCIAAVEGGVRRMRTINVWRKWLHNDRDCELIVPARGKTSAALWAANKTTGTVTQFHRGKKLADYRATLVAAKTLKDLL